MAAKKKTTKSKSKTSRKTTKSKTAKKTTRKTTKTSKNTTKKTSAKKKPFGGYSISFAGRKETVEQVFGKKPIAPSQMTKKIWAFVKAKKLSTNSS